MREQVETILQALLAASLAVPLMGCAANPLIRITDKRINLDITARCNPMSICHIRTSAFH